VNRLVNARASITDSVRDGVETFRVSSRQIRIRLVNARASITDSVRDRVEDIPCCWWYEILE